MTVQQSGLHRDLHYTYTAHNDTLILKVGKDILHLICNKYSMSSSYVASDIPHPLNFCRESTSFYSISKNLEFYFFYIYYMFQLY